MSKNTFCIKHFGKHTQMFSTSLRRFMMCHCLTHTDLLDLRHLVRQHPDTALCLGTGFKKNLKRQKVQVNSHEPKCVTHGHTNKQRYMKRSCRTLMTSTFSSVGVMSLSVSSCSSGFCGSTTAMLLSCVESNKKCKCPVLDFCFVFFYLPVAVQ